MTETDIAQLDRKLGNETNDDSVTLKRIGVIVNSRKMIALQYFKKQKLSEPRTEMYELRG